ncbi:MAG: hypothetical protein Q8K05_02830 [Polaromonas sp.]|nr:hypothetical protein [Polaromonas sp.]MDP2254986.1 hypothetical protein [Polaromonas sp.]
MIDKLKIIEALSAYRLRLKEQGRLVKAATVEHCIAIIRRL